MFWATVTGLSQEPSRSATLAALEAAEGITVLDLDYRPMFWSSREEARRWVQEALPHVTSRSATATSGRPPAETPTSTCDLKHGPGGRARPPP